ncbi:MAG TPA: SDR family oxidoreductase [Steroidobacteraceae bacterium]|nr:SDR family oxidoreductase [Steroidobacteraceae bacterium]
MLRIDDLANKSILITGASSGIGAALSRAFAEQGARIAVHFSSNAAAADRVMQDVRRAGGVGQLVQGDLTRVGDAKRIVDVSADALQGLDILINNAGSLVSRRAFLEADDAWVDSVFNLNARAVIQTCQAAVPHMVRRGGGAIINVGSIAGLDGGGSGAGIYGAAKAFVHNLTRHLAREFAAQNIRVNAVSPGVVDTPFHRATPPERMEAMRRSVPLGRIGKPDDCVGAFLFLASGTLSRYVTGQNIHVNGGQVMP